MEKHLAKHVPNLRALAERTHPVDKRARAKFLMQITTQAASTLGSAEPEELATRVLNMDDSDIEEFGDHDYDLEDLEASRLQEHPTADVKALLAIVAPEAPAKKKATKKATARRK